MICETSCKAERDNEASIPAKRKKHFNSGVKTTPPICNNHTHVPTVDSNDQISSNKIQQENFSQPKVTRKRTGVGLNVTIKKKAKLNSPIDKHSHNHADIKSNISEHSQRIALQNLTKFHNSLKYTIYHCKICQEAWPLKSKPKNYPNYICSRCSRDKCVPKKFSNENFMIPSPVPKELQNLTQFEEMLIARAFPVMHVYTKPRGGQRAYKGHVITLPQDVQQLADVLPRCPKDLPVIVFTVNGKDNCSKDFIVRRNKVSDALNWLTGVNKDGEPNNFLYKDVQISKENLDELPENGVLLNVSKVECGIKVNEQSDSNVDIDRGPVDFDDNETVYNSESEMGSFIPANIETKKEKEIIEDQFVKQPTHNWTIGSEPLSEFDVQFLASMAFPTLFPDGKGDPTNNAVVSDISNNSTQSFADKLKHLIKFAQYIDGKWIYRFASHPRFAYWAYNILYRKRILGQSNFFLKQNPTEANLTIEDLRQMITSHSYESLISKLMRYAKNVCGTNAYWNRAKDDLKAIITQVGVPTIFWTLSCAEFHWPEFHDLFNNANELSDAQRRENVINNPHLLDWFFTERTEQFVKHWLKNTLGATWHWFRYEYAVQRGSIHCHGVAKLESDPGLCDLSQTALKGYLANQLVEDNNLSPELLLEKEEQIKKGKEAEEIICSYVDSLISTQNPTNPDDGDWVKPVNHPCKLTFENVQHDWDNDYENLVNLVQRHTTCSTAYCLHNKGGSDEVSCRFGFPKETCDKTHLEYETFKSKDGREHYKVKVETKRNDSRLNNNQRLQLQGWRANCDIQVIIDYHSCLEYIAKYASKGEKMSTVAKDAFTSVLANSQNVDNGRKAIKKLMMRTVGQRDMSIQEVMHQILSIKLVSSSFQVITASLDGSRKVSLSEHNTLETENSLLDLYAKRKMFESDHPGISNCNFVKFASNYFKTKLGIAKRRTPVVLKTFPNYSSNPKNLNYGLFCRYQLLRYKPWNNSVNDAWCNEETSDAVFINHWHSFLQTNDAILFVPNWSHQINLISEYANQLIENDDFVETNTNEREEWMILADLKLKDDNKIKSPMDCSADFYEQDRLKYTVQEIGDMPHWIKEQKNSNTLKKEQALNPVDINRFNDRQKIAYQIVQNHFMCTSENKEQLLMMITGLGGSGKSYVIQALTNILNKKCRVCAYFGIAAFNIKGYTLHSLLQLPIKGKKNGPLNSSALARLQHDLDDVQYLIIDEFSVVGQKMFAWINRRCKQATGNLTVPFGGMSIILVGDIAQLPPVTDQVLYHTRPNCDLALEGYCMYQMFQKVINFEINERAAGADNEQQRFRALQVRARDGNSNLEDWNMLLLRQPQNVINIDTFQKSAVKLSFGNEKVDTDNYQKLKELQQTIVQIDAHHSNPKAKRLSSEDMGGLEPTIYLSKQARVMLTRNLWTEAGLCNGTMGTIKDIIFSENHTSPMLPVAIIVQFDNNYIGPSYCKDTPNCVPICPVTNTSTSLGNNLERIQFPLKLAWSMTIHKSQGLTLDKCWIDLGTSERVAGLTYVALSRVCKISDLVIEPVTFERLHSLKKTSNYKYRLLEEARLEKLAQDTLSKHLKKE